MSHTMTSYEMHALHNFAVALRPDWANNRCGSTWQNTLGGNTFPEAENFIHAMKALHAYATMQAADGTHVKRTPKLYPEPGDWWETTRPENAATKQPACEQHPDYGTITNCVACKSEIAAGERPENMLGKHYNPLTPEGYPDVVQPPHERR